MHTEALFTFFMQVALVLMRVGALWMFFPIFAHGSIPGPVRMAGAITLSVALVPVAAGRLPAWSLTQAPEAGELVLFVIREVLIGAGMGLVARFFFSAASSSAHWLGMQMGFSAGGILDPEFQQQESPWGEFHNWVAMVVFFSVGGHLLLIRAIADSYQVSWDPMFQRLGDPAAGAEFWVEVGKSFFNWVLKLSGPMVTVLLLIQSALGILSKFVPQINIWSVSIPITIAAGVIVTALLSPVYFETLSALMEADVLAARSWMRAMGGGP